MSTDRDAAEVANVLKEIAKNISRQNEILMEEVKEFEKPASLTLEETISLLDKELGQHR